MRVGSLNEMKLSIVKMFIGKIYIYKRCTLVSTITCESIAEYFFLLYFQYLYLFYLNLFLFIFFVFFFPRKFAMKKIILTLLLASLFFFSHSHSLSHSLAQNSPKLTTERIHAILFTANFTKK